jgi:hypothetical protein
MHRLLFSEDAISGFVVRIHSQWDGGTGFPIYPEYIVTCAHVAIGRACQQREIASPRDKVRVQFAASVIGLAPPMRSKSGPLTWPSFAFVLAPGEPAPTQPELQQDQVPKLPGVAVQRLCHPLQAHLEILRVHIPTLDHLELLDLVCQRRD